MLQRTKKNMRKPNRTAIQVIFFSTFLGLNCSGIQVGHQCWSCFDFSSQSQLLESAKEKKTIKCKQADDNVINPFLKIFFHVQSRFYLTKKRIFDAEPLIKYQFHWKIMKADRFFDLKFFSHEGLLKPIISHQYRIE